LFIIRIKTPNIMGCINAKRRKEALRKGIDVTPTKRTKTYLKQNNEQNESPSNGRCNSEPYFS
jgi:hypothetical protein